MNQPLNMNTYIIVFIVISISAISIYKYYDSRNWTETPATINSIKLTTIQNRPNSSMSTNKSFSEYKIDVTYSYTYADQSFTGSQVYPAIPNVFSDKSFAMNLLSQYPQDKTTTIFVNPDTPSESCLMQASKLSLFTIIISLLIFTGIAAILITGISYFNKIFDS